jgi:hypothetical protein
MSPFSLSPPRWLSAPGAHALANHRPVGRELALPLLTGLAAHPGFHRRHLGIPSAAGLRDRHQVHAAEVTAVAADGIDLVIVEGELAQGIGAGHPETVYGNSTPGERPAGFPFALSRGRPVALRPNSAVLNLVRPRMGQVRGFARQGLKDYT